MLAAVYDDGSYFIIQTDRELYQAKPQPHIVVIMRHPAHILVPASQDPYTRQLMVTDIPWPRLLSPSTTFALLLFDFPVTMDPISVLTGILDLTDRCIKGYDFFKDVKNAPKACLELIETLEADRAMIAELQDHVNRLEGKEKVQLPASLQNYKRTLDKLDAVSNKYRDPKFKFNFVARATWVLSGEKEIKELRDDLKRNSGNFQPLLLQMA